MPLARLSYSALRDLQESTRDRATWTADAAQYHQAEYWAELRDVGGGRLQGDCEDYAITWLHRLMLDGQPMEWRTDDDKGMRFGLVALNVPKSHFDHCVLIVPASNGIEYVMDCNLPAPVSFEMYGAGLVRWGIRRVWKDVVYR